MDHLVAGKLVVEDKALPHALTNDEIAQVITYLAATNFGTGLLLNFARNRLEYRRIFPPTNRTDWVNRVRRYVWTPRRT
jgi:GxxExxY protein